MTAPEVPPQGGYLAKRCPVRAQWDVVRPAEPRTDSPVLERRLARGREFEQQVVARLIELHPGATLIGPGERADREAATLAAMQAAAPLILGGRLPADLVGRRVGEPDLLIPADGRAGYRPVDIKHHRCLDADPGRPPARCSPLHRLGWAAAEPVPGSVARNRREDLLQLAHYQRMLEAAGLAAHDGRLAGIIGVDHVVTWHDLDAVAGRQDRRSAMQTYDAEFGSGSRWGHAGHHPVPGLGRLPHWVPGVLPLGADDGGRGDRAVRGVLDLAGRAARGGRRGRPDVSRLLLQRRRRGFIHRLWSPSLLPEGSLTPAAGPGPVAGMPLGIRPAKSVRFGATAFIIVRAAGR